MSVNKRKSGWKSKPFSHDITSSTRGHGDSNPTILTTSTRIIHIITIRVNHRTDIAHYMSNITVHLIRNILHQF